MKIGLMSDTHDRIESTEKAIDFFNISGVEHVLHAGDLVSPFIASKFIDLKAELHYVWGNNDGDREHIKSNFNEIGVDLLGNFAVLEFNSRKIALIHGTNENFIQALAKSGEFDAVVRGHTHKSSIQEDPMIINPGEVCGYLSDDQTVALLNLNDMSVEIIRI